MKESTVSAKVICNNFINQNTFNLNFLQDVPYFEFNGIRSSQSEVL